MYIKEKSNGIKDIKNKSNGIKSPLYLHMVKQAMAETRRTAAITLPIITPLDVLDAARKDEIK